MTATNNAQVRALDPISQDWTFGQSGNNFQQNQNSIIQNIATRLRLLAGECFFSTSSGVDWLTLLGSKITAPINLAIATAITNTAGVTGIISLNSSLNHETREFSLSYNVQTIYSVSIVDEFTYSLNGVVTGG